MIYDVIIVGGGIAALTAGIYTSRKKLNTLLIAEEIGGQTFKAPFIENYPGYKSISGIDFILKTKKQLLELKVSIKEFEIVKNIIKKNNILIVKTDNSEYKTKTVIIASGKKPRKLNIPGEKEFLGKGVAYCATCDAPLFTNKIVSVIGSGNSGLASAMELSKYAKKVTILEASDHSIGDNVLLEKIKKDPKFDLILNAKIIEIMGNKMVNKIIYKNEKNEKISLAVDGVFIEIGWIVDANFLPKEVKRNKNNEIIINQKNGATSLGGLYAAGDVTDSIYKQIVIAAGSGAIAALSVNDYINR